MRQIILTLHPQAPLAIGRQKPGGSVSEVEKFIPGSVIRGALAGQMLRSSGYRPSQQVGGDFERLFLGEDAAIFTNAYRCDRDGLDVRVLPATAVSSKTRGGFKDGEDPGACGVFDTLIDRFSAGCCSHPYDPSSPSDPDDRIESYSGFYTTERSPSGRPAKAPAVSTRLLTRVGINRRRATAEENILYSLQVLNEVEPDTQATPTRFQGMVAVNDDALAAELVKYLKGCELRLGGSLSRGLGRVVVGACLTKPTNGVAERMTKFNTTLKNRFKRWQDLFSSPAQPGSQPGSWSERFYFALGLQADAILAERWQRTTVISERMLQEATGLRDGSLTLHTAYATHDYRSGWNSAWGLMKDVELVTRQGAVYLYSIDQDAEGQWAKALQLLEHRGIGARTAEGFGQLRVSDEFHVIFRENAI